MFEKYAHTREDLEEALEYLERPELYFIVTEGQKVGDLAKFCFTRSPCGDLALTTLSLSTRRYDVVIRPLVRIFKTSTLINTRQDRTNTN